MTTIHYNERYALFFLDTKGEEQQYEDFALICITSDEDAQRFIDKLRTRLPDRPPETAEMRMQWLIFANLENCITL